MADASRALRILVLRVVREPLLHFALLGASIFGLSQYFDDRSRFTKITITAEEIARISDNYRLQYGGTPSAQQLDGLVDSFIQEEVFYREALRLGLDAGDEIVRRRLAQKYEFLQLDLIPPKEPTDPQLQVYYNQHRNRYLRPATVTFTHVYFSPDTRGVGGAEQAARALAARLNRQGMSLATDPGDEFPGAANFVAASGDQLRRVFGREGLAEAVFGIERRRWSAPLRSGLGWHTVYVTALEPETQIPFPEIRENVRRDYMETARSNLYTKAYEKLRSRFQIVREQADARLR